MRKFIVCLACLILLGPNISAPNRQSPKVQDKLDKILAKTGAYCERLKKMAFDFVCNENIHEQTNIFNRRKTWKRTVTSAAPMEVTELSLRRTRTKTYLYDYQMIKKGEKIQEKRILLKENRRKKNEPNAELKISRYWAKYLVFGPVGFLSKTWQDQFSYTITDEEEIDGKETIIIQASPIFPRKDNYNFGKIWVDIDDFSIRKIEWDQKSILDFKEAVDTSIGDLKRSLSWTVFYRVEKNGVRFPSQQIISEYLITHMGKAHLKYNVIINYEDYKFFTVETEVKY